MTGSKRTTERQASWMLWSRLNFLYRHVFFLHFIGHGYVNIQLTICCVNLGLLFGFQHLRVGVKYLNARTFFLFVPKSLQI